MNEFMINLLPREATSIARAGSRRRMGWALTGATCFVLVFASAHSFLARRGAAAACEVASALRENAHRLDDMTAALAAERATLTARLSTQRALGLSVEPSDIIATISHLMPEGMELEALRLKAESSRAPVQAAAKKAAKSGAAKDPAQVAPDEAFLTCRLAGSARDDREITEFVTRLAATAPFTGVTVAEQGAGSEGGANRKFVITFSANPFASSQGTTVARSGS